MAHKVKQSISPAAAAQRGLPCSAASRVAATPAHLWRSERRRKSSSAPQSPWSSCLSLATQCHTPAAAAASRWSLRLTRHRPPGRAPGAAAAGVVGPAAAPAPGPPLTPLPSFCCTSYFFSTCRSISSDIVRQRWVNSGWAAAARAMRLECGIAIRRRQYRERGAIVAQGCLIRRAVAGAQHGPGQLLVMV